MGIFPDHIKVEQVNASALPKLDKSLGLTVTEINEDSLVAELKVTDAVLQPFGIMHGGVSCLIGESLGSVAGSMTLKDPNMTIVGQSLYALHLRAVYSGMTLIAKAKPQHIGRRSHVWDIFISDKESEKPTARITLTLAIIEKKPKSS